MIPEMSQKNGRESNGRLSGEHGWRERVNNLDHAVNAIRIKIVDVGASPIDGDPPYK